MRFSSRLRLALAMLSWAALAPASVHACDSSACLLVTRGQNGVLAKGAWRIDLSYRQTDQTALLGGHEEVDQVLRPKVDFENRRVRPGYHDEIGGRERFVQADVAYGLSGRATVLASFPLYSRRAFDIGHPPVVRETYVTTGNGDALLGVRFALTTRTASPLVAGLSLKLPTGRYKLESPPNRADVGILDPTIQPGSGSMDVVGSLQWSRRLAGVGWSLSGSYQRTRENGLGYRFGDDAIASVTASRPAFARLTASVQLKYFHKGRSGYLGEDVPSTGSTVVYAIPGLSLSAWKDLSLYGYATVPLYRYVNDEQLGPRLGFIGGVSRTF